jgi:cytochrome c biogenesis protein CcdA
VVDAVVHTLLARTVVVVLGLLVAYSIGVSLPIILLHYTTSPLGASSKVVYSPDEGSSGPIRLLCL